MSSPIQPTAWPTEPCRSCHAPVIWSITEQAKVMPVDAEPSSAGTLALEWRDRASGLPGGAPPLVRVVRPDLRFGRTDLRTSHFATCPQANAWRKRNAARGRQVAP